MKQDLPEPTKGTQVNPSGQFGALAIHKNDLGSIQLTALNLRPLVLERTAQFAPFAFRGSSIPHSTANLETGSDPDHHWPLGSFVTFVQISVTP